MFESIVGLFPLTLAADAVICVLTPFVLLRNKLLEPPTYLMYPAVGVLGFVNILFDPLMIVSAVKLLVLNIKFTAPLPTATAEELMCRDEEVIVLPTNIIDPDASDIV
jgi:hypothetical protein